MSLNPSNSGDMSGDITPNASGTSSYGLYAAGLTAITGALADAQATSAFKDKLAAETHAAIQNVGNAITSFELQQIKNAENISNINQVLGNKLSERGLNAMKEASLLKAAAAETGTSGGTTDLAIKEAFINENMDKANIVASARQQQKSIYASMGIQALALNNQIDSTLLGGGVSVNTNPLFAGLSGGLSNITNTLSMLPDSEKSQIFGI
jgi:hypothetical protein